MKNIFDHLQSISTGKLVLVLFAITNLVYGTILAYSIPLVLSFSPDAILFDMSPAGYSFVQAMELLQALGSDGRHAYLTVQLPIDFVYPGLFAVSYAILLIWVFKKVCAQDSNLYWLACVPVLAGLFDYLENVSIIMMINRFPELSEGLVSLASGFTIVKSVLTTLFFVILISALIAWAVKSVRKR